jgi:hypothetical protein
LPLTRVSIDALFISGAAIPNSNGINRDRKIFSG